jgi:hypothetical protein
MSVLCLKICWTCFHKKLLCWWGGPVSLIGKLIEGKRHVIHQHSFLILIGILCWSRELGCIDIHLSVAFLAQYFSQPWCITSLPCVCLFESICPFKDCVWSHSAKVDENSFEKNDWSDFYCNAREAIPQNTPKPRGKPIIISCFVDANHAGNSITRCSHPGILIFCNIAAILWYLKHQITVETSTFSQNLLQLRFLSNPLRHYNIS